MFARHLHAELEARLRESPSVALLGPRQVGKTTLALEIGQAHDAVYLDLESERDRAKLDEAELYLEPLLGRLVIFDEVHRVPGLFPLLRGLIDRARRAGRRHGLYLLLGSASLDLLKQSGESLAGRVDYLELGGLDALEIEGSTSSDEQMLWERGGFPESLLAPSSEASMRWREAFVRTYLERDIPQLGPRISAENLRRLWTMLAHHQGGLLNMAALARSLGVDGKTVTSYLDLLVDLLLVRRLAPWHENVGKRLVRSPKVYVRDSGLVHALLGLGSLDALLGHPIVGASYEGFVIENLLSAAPRTVTPYFYRTSAGAEVDLLLVWPSGERWAIEIERSLSPRAKRGFHHASIDLEPARRFLVYPGKEAYQIKEGLEVVPLAALARELLTRRQGELR